jgi:tetratricopeptide (TPR) repeat protein
MLKRLGIVILDCLDFCVLLICELAQALGLRKAAAAWYEFRFRRQPPRQAEFASRLGFLYERSGELHKASEWYGVAQRLRPDDPVLYADLAYVLERQNDIPGALTNYRLSLGRGSQVSNECRDMLRQKIGELEKLRPL